MKKILVVEDDHFLLSAYKVKFSKKGFDVKTATDGQDALSVLESFEPDLILLDLVMPRLDGFETLKKLKENDKLKKIPVIVASNLGQKDDLDKAMALGANDYIIKSNISLDKIIEKINRHLEIH